MDSRKEITQLSDVELLMRQFYDKVLVDPLLSPHFEGLDIEAHLPRITAFWAFILLDMEGYKGNVMDKHLHLNIGKEHFERWVTLFTETVDELYIGPKAELAKQRARVLQYTFQSKMEHLRGLSDQNPS